MEAFGFERIKQYPGVQQVARKVEVDVPGKHLSRAPTLRYCMHRVCVKVVGDVT